MARYASGSHMIAFALGLLLSYATSSPTSSPTMEPTSEMVLSYAYATPAPVPAPTKQPIPAPTPMPTSFPTSTDTYATPAPVPAPTKQPIPAPTPMPTSFPTSTGTVAIAVSVAMSTTESTVSDSQKSTLKTSVAAASGVSENSIKDFAVIVAPARRRLSESPKVSLRRLASYTWTINYKVVSSLSAAGHASVESFQAAIETSLQANLATTVLTDMGIAVVVTGVSTFATATPPTALYDCHGDDPDCIYIERFWGAANCTGWPGRRGTYDRIWYNSTMANGVCSNRSTWSADLFQVASCNEEGVFFKQNCEDSECTKCDSDAFQ
mmetsp:Transcript_17828/g.40844  ORF Transcript_17828/g.40844 Transcript_17828/m.40844 type:complete len:324 (-) Transcript_17828:227-1198(-)